MNANAPGDRSRVYRLTLYISHASSATERIAESIRQWCAGHKIALELTTVEVLDAIELAVERGIFATPMLVRESPPPERRVVGDISDTAKVLRLLEIHGADEARW